MTLENCCDDVCFTELVNCYEEGGYMKAHGWTQSTGHSGAFIYHPPSPWEYDPSFSDTGGGIGTHGGCPNCIMTLVHLRKPIASPTTDPAPTISRLQAEVRALEAQVADLQRKIAEMKTQYRI